MRRSSEDERRNNEAASVPWQNDYVRRMSS